MQAGNFTKGETMDFGDTQIVEIDFQCPNSAFDWHSKKTIRIKTDILQSCPECKKTFTVRHPISPEEAAWIEKIQKEKENELS